MDWGPLNRLLTAGEDVRSITRLNQALSRASASATTDLSAPKTNSLEPVPLYHDIQLGTEGPVIVRNTTRTQTGPDTFVWSSKLFLLTFNKSTLVHGTEVLDERFVRGWNKLPHELKLQILSHDPDLSSVFMTNMSYVPGKPSGWDTLARYHAMTPETGALATQMYYKTIRFKITIESPIRITASVFLPNKLVATFVHRLSVRVPLTTASWAKLAKIANGEYGFDNLKKVGVDLDMAPFLSWVNRSPGPAHVPFFLNNQMAFVGDMRRMPIRFRCQGSFKVLFDVDSASLWDHWDWLDDRIDSLVDQDRVGDYLQFGVEE